MLFCESDAAKALGYTNPSKALSDHCKGVTKRYTPTTSGEQEVEGILLNCKDRREYPLRYMNLPGISEIDFRRRKDEFLNCKISFVNLKFDLQHLIKVHNWYRTRL